MDFSDDNFFCRPSVAMSDTFNPVWKKLKQAGTASKGLESCKQAVSSHEHAEAPLILQFDDISS